jgi:stage II sporulation SpoE-like protein
MYADGLIERRGEDLREGIARVAERLQAWRSGAPLVSLCDEMVASLAAEPQLDDMCLLAVTRPQPDRTRGEVFWAALRASPVDTAS